MKNLINKHKEKLGVEPKIIGMFWSSPYAVMDSITKAIKDGKPYNEYELLSKEEQEAFDKGELLF